MLVRCCCSGWNNLSCSSMSTDVKVTTHRTIILTVVLYEWETWSLILREEYSADGTITLFWDVTERHILFFWDMTERHILLSWNMTDRHILFYWNMTERHILFSDMTRLHSMFWDMALRHILIFWDMTQSRLWDITRRHFLFWDNIASHSVIL
jgi:hypothetical protein